MDGISIAMIAGLYANFFFIYYKLGKIENQVKKLNNKGSMSMFG